MKIPIFKISLIIIFCLNSKRILSQDICRYKVISIDSTFNNYIFKMKNNKKVFLVVSPKSDSLIKGVEKIQLGNSYNLRLKKLAINFVLNESVNDNKLLIEGKDISVDRGKVYFSDNLIGLFYIPKTDDVLKSEINN